MTSSRKPGGEAAFEAKVAPFEFKFASNEPDGTFEGYGAVFGNEDDNGDMLMRGAFDKTLASARSSGQMPKMLLNHGGLAFGNPTAESMIPIGKWAKMSSDAHGLQVKGKLINLDTETGKRIYGAMKEGELGGLSMGFRAREFVFGTKPSEPFRTLKAVDLFEVSPVTFPANPLALVSGVKSAARIGTIREFEAFLRDAGGFSHAAAKAIAASGFKATPDPRDEDGNGDELAALLRRAAALRNPAP
jgi:HK97 family phage prohead protease